MCNTWYEMHCPKCRANNWFNNGDTSDLTVGDINAVKCWSCGHLWRLSGDDEFDPEDASGEAECAEEGKNMVEVKLDKEKENPK